MRILLKLSLDVDPDAAWRAVHSPAALAQLYGPLLEVAPLDAPPTAWRSGDDTVVHLHAGPVPLGRQLVEVTDRRREHHGRPVRIMRDSGIPLTGPLAALRVWDHQIAVSADPAGPGRTLWRERLVIGGPAAAALWPALWTTWQWRGRRIRSLAPTWAYDPPPESPPSPDGAPGEAS